MKELKEGMYVRTKEGKIFNCFTSESMGKPVYYIKDSLTNGFIDYNEAYKVSTNIIDIVQVGDYVNGLRVEKNKYGELYTSYVYYGGDIGKMCEVYTTWLKEYKEDEIYSIVTKEQLSSIAFQLEKQKKY